MTGNDRILLSRDRCCRFSFVFWNRCDERADIDTETGTTTNQEREQVEEDKKEL